MASFNLAIFTDHRSQNHRESACYAIIQSAQSISNFSRQNAGRPEMVGFRKQIREMLLIIFDVIHVKN